MSEKRTSVSGYRAFSKELSVPDRDKIAEERADADAIVWTAEQRKVIDAAEGARLLVNAGPGTGKTAIGCARIAHLIEELGIPASQIWLVSFTRTAVQELRHRIGSHLKDQGATAGIRISTIDSYAWAIHSGFMANAKLTGSFDDNIDHAIHLVQTNEGVFSYLAQARHLVIDEAQDVVGKRCEFLLEMIHAVPAEAGVTVLADEAQSIYGFADEDSESLMKGTLPEKIREYADEFKPKFRMCELTAIHRTSDKLLRELFGEGRSIVMKGKKTGAARLEELREFVTEGSHGHLGSHRTDLTNLPESMDSTFLLFRRRGEALEASSYLRTRPHRVRMSGLPAVVHDWVGRMFWDWVAPEMDQLEFKTRWNNRMGPDKQKDFESAWSLLVRIVGISKSRISVDKLASRLGGGSPPIDFCDPDFGTAGPVIGTIHGAKGREADKVRLYLPPTRENQDDDEAAEEARVLFVGATRARVELQIGQGATKALARRVDTSGRAFTAYPWSRGRSRAAACVEIGRGSDIEATSLAGKSLFASAKEVTKAQGRIQLLSGRMSEAEGRMGSKSQAYRYNIFSLEQTDDPICFLSERVNKDMFKIAETVDGLVHLHRKNPPAKLPYLRIFGTRTIALRPDDPIRETLHAPWCDSGFLVAPMLLGYGMVFFS
jgi:hypothetical protein